MSEVGPSIDVMEYLPTIVQPRLQMSVATAAEIAAGRAHQVGGVVRDVESGRLVELLSDAPDIDDVVAGVAEQLKKARLPTIDMSKIELPKLDPKTAAAAAGALRVAGVAVGGFKWVMSRRRAGEALVQADLVVDELVDASVEVPECLVNLRASLRNYVDAGRDGVLTSEAIGTLMTDLDAVQAYAEDGNAVFFTLDELLPFFELVTAHTAVLANAYQVNLDEPDANNGGVVVSLRRHLEAQNRILTQAA